MVILVLANFVLAVVGAVAISQQMPLSVKPSPAATIKPTTVAESEVTFNTWEVESFGSNLTSDGSFVQAVKINAAVKRTADIL